MATGPFRIPARRARNGSRGGAGAPAIGLAAFLVSIAFSRAFAWTFTDVSVASGAGVFHGVNNGNSSQRLMTAGAACGDYDRDGWPDLYTLGGNLGRDRLMRNNGDGTFTDVATGAGISRQGTLCTGATFADWTGDGWLDLFVGGIEATDPRMYRNNGDGTFSDVTVASGLWYTDDTLSATFADLDNDRDLDMLLAHWGVTEGPGHLWRNEGDGTFTEIDSLAGYTGYSDSTGMDWTFTYNVADLNGDGWNDLLVAADFVTSHVFLNDGDGTFTNVTDRDVIDDDNGMGAAVGDFDRDGDLDWFVTSINGATPNHDGNRMYVNDGTGVLSDGTDAAGVRAGGWGWAATFQDFDNDGWLDIYHVNGWPASIFQNDLAVLFVANGDGTFTDQSVALGTAHPGQGRGLCSLDYDRDGDLDLFLTNYNQPCVLLRNDGGNDGNWLDVRLEGLPPNVTEIGARVTAEVDGALLLRVVRGGNNFLSQDPEELHFGLGAATSVDRLTVEWTDGTVTVLEDVPGNQVLVLSVTDLATGAVAAEAGVELLAPYPNPFLERTAMAFRLSRAGSTRIFVHDASGRLVREVAQGPLPAGRHRVVWDGRDRDGGRVAAGVYYLALDADGKLSRAKVVRLR